MRNDELIEVFDDMAESYDAQWDGMEPIRDGFYLLMGAMFALLPDDARILCVGAGTGLEVAYLARRFPSWRFTVVEPSGPMLEICRGRADREGFTSRCTFYHGFLDEVPLDEVHDGATCLLVSHFILDRAARSAFFRTIADRLRPGGLLASSDLASGAVGTDFETLLRIWMSVVAGGIVSAERLNRTREAFAKDVAVLGSAEVASIIAAGGFEQPVQFFQAGCLHAWCSRRRETGSAEAAGT